MLIDREKMLVLPFRKTCHKAGLKRPHRFQLASHFRERRVLVTVITGFNTDIEHDGVIYHVQTEDKGLDSPIILSLVYAGGTILKPDEGKVYKSKMELIEGGSKLEVSGCVAFICKSQVWLRQ